MVVALDGLSSHEFAESYERAEGVRLLFVRARFHLENHIQEHGCMLAAKEEAAEAS